MRSVPGARAKVRKRLRKERGMSQVDLAFESGPHRTYISGIERGIRNVGLDNMGVIAAAPKVAPDELLRKDGLLGTARGASST